MKKLYGLLFIVLFFTTALVLLAAVIRGQAGNPIYHQTQEERNKKVGSPFESTGSTSRYAMIEAMVEDQTFFLNEERAKFAAPDVVQYKGKLFSIFTPGVAFLGIPFYIIGKTIGFPQFITFLSTAILALINLCLVAQIAKKFGAGRYSAILSGFIFLFATSAVSYALTLTQHHLSTAIILLALISSMGKTTFLKNAWFGILFSAGLLVDIPNGIMMTPIGIYMLIKHFKKLEPEVNQIKFRIKLSFVAILIGMIPLLAVFGWYNHETTGSYTTIAQTIGRSDYFEPPEIREQNRLEKESQDAFDEKLPFDTRNQISEFYILLVSNQRGWLIYSPIILIGALGLYYVYKKEKTLATVIISVILSNIIVYSLFGGLGGWAFGPRYLIPAAAILSAAIGITVERFRRNVFFIVAFIILLAYSLGVNTIGAMTTTQVPPKVEAVNLPNPIPYTYEYNLQLIDKNLTSSLVYNLYLFKFMSVREFLYAYYAVVLTAIVSAYLFVLFGKEKKYDQV